jgi:hypothetical protein
VNPRADCSARRHLDVPLLQPMAGGIGDVDVGSGGHRACGLVLNIGAGGRELNLPRRPVPFLHYVTGVCNYAGSSCILKDDPT